MELILVRHGQSESNARLTTALDASLTPLGIKQAATTAEYLAEVIKHQLGQTTLLVSPFKRTLQTAEPLATLSNCPALLYPKMCEYFTSDTEGYGSFNGLSHTDIERDFAPLCKHASTLDAAWWPGKLESLYDLYNRVNGVKSDIWSRYGSKSETVIIFSHAEPIGRLIEVLIGAEHNPGWPPWTRNCGINRLNFSSLDLPAELVSFDDVSHLESKGLVSPVFS